MIKVIANTFPLTYNYGPLEKQVLESTIKQITEHYSSDRNLLLNMTWFGPQFDNGKWTELEDLLLNKHITFDNVFLLSTIDPVYLSEDLIHWLVQQSQAKRVIRIGSWEHADYEWNWHAGAAHSLMPMPALDQVKMTSAKYVFTCYQRKPRLHRIELTNLILEAELNKKGIITLGGGSQQHADIYANGILAPNITLNENLNQFVEEDECGGIPCDLFGLGPIEVWQNHFLNIVSETEFNNWHRMFVTEKTWKPMVGLRPFIIHGQTRIYSWLRSNGFKTFNHYWPHIPCETEDQHSNIINVLNFLCNKSKNELMDMYTDMLPDLTYNRERFIEFAAEQRHCMDHIFY